jgi:hypothetical protein
LQRHHPNHHLPPLIASIYLKKINQGIAAAEKVDVLKTFAKRNAMSAVTGA